MTESNPSRQPIILIVSAAYALVIGVVLWAAGGQDQGLMLGIGAAVGVVLLIATAISPYMGLMVYLALYFTRPFERYESLQNTRLLYAIGLMTIAFTVAQYLIARRPSLVRHPANLALAFYMACYCWSGVQWGITGYVIPNFKGVLMIPLIIYALLLLHARTPERQRALAWILTFSLTYVAVTAFATRDPEAQIRVKSFGHFSDPNDLAMIMVALLPVPFALFAAERGVTRRTYLVGVILYMLAVIWETNSRGGLIGLAVVCLASVLDRLPSRRMVVPATLLFGFVALAGLNLGFARRGGGVGDAASGGSGLGRRASWQAAINMCLDKPLTGVGPHKYKDDQRHYYPDWGPGGSYMYTEAHSFFFQVVGELGVPGTTALLLLFWRFGVISPLNIRRYLSLLEPTRFTYHYGRCLRNCVWGWVGCAFFLTQAYKFSLFMIIAMVVSFEVTLKELYELDHGPIVSGAWSLRPWIPSTGPPAATVGPTS